MAQTLQNMDQLSGQLLAREITKDITKGELMLGPGLVKSIAEVFTGPEQAQEFFNIIRKRIESSNSREEVISQYNEILNSLREKNRTKAISVLNTILDRYSKRVPGMDRAGLIYELYSSPSLTKEIEEHWPKAKK